jgi:hypothetical protein
MIPYLVSGDKGKKKSLIQVGTKESGHQAKGFTEFFLTLFAWGTSFISIQFYSLLGIWPKVLN